VFVDAWWTVGLDNRAESLQRAYRDALPVIRSQFEDPAGDMEHVVTQVRAAAATARPPVVLTGAPAPPAPSTGPGAARPAAR
jgi:hypothetical protein